MEFTIEKHIGETLYKEFFYPCKTLCLLSKYGETRTFIEYTGASDHGRFICPNIEASEVAVGNAVLRLISEGNDDFFFDESDTEATPIYIHRRVYRVKYGDATEQWANHYWTRLKKPLVGFKAVSSDGKSVLASFQSKSLCYSIGKTYSVDEKEMIDRTDLGFYFSPCITKALSYVKKDEKILLVVASGLIHIKNNWDDLCASNLSIVKELSHEEINLFNPPIPKPKALYNGDNWIFTS